MIPIWLHLTLITIAQFGGALAAAVLVMVNMRSVEGFGLNGTFAFFGAFILGYLMPRLVMKYVISARCPQCGGGARFRGGRPISYVCRECGHDHQTNVYEGRRRR